MLAPGKIWPGTSLRIEVSFTDEDGVAIDPATVTFMTIDPCCGQTTYVYLTDAAVGKSGTGNYYADITIPTNDSAGRWGYRWSTTGASTTIADEGNFIVQRSKFFDNDCCYGGYGYWYC